MRKLIRTQIQLVSTLRKQERTFILFTSGLMRKNLVGEAKLLAI
jgi:hypothetical protein